MKVITLLTDFTETDGYVGIMKGVILGIAPDARIVDLSHDIPPQNVLQAALTLGRSAPYFPEGTIHVGVIDPGVGTERRGMACRFGGQYFVGPDNGLCTLLLEQTRINGGEVQLVSLENPDYRLPEVSRSFHGRDVFAPAAAHLAAGAELASFGGPISDPVLLEIPEPRSTAAGWEGEVLYADAFGNLAVNIRREHLADAGSVDILVKERKLPGISETFGDGRPGELTAIIDSFGFLSICVVNGSAAKRLDASAGETVFVTIK